MGDCCVLHGEIVGAVAPRDEVRRPQCEYGGATTLSLEAMILQRDDRAEHEYQQRCASPSIRQHDLLGLIVRQDDKQERDDSQTADIRRRMSARSMIFFPSVRMPLGSTFRPGVPHSARVVVYSAVQIACSS